MMRGRAPLIAGIVAGVVVLLLVMLFVLPKMGEVGDVEDELQVARDQEVALQTELRALQDAQAQAPQTEEEIQALTDQVPTTVDLPGLFRLLQAIADRSAVDFFQFTPGTPTPDASLEFSVLSSQITVTGTYFSLQEYLYSLETLARANKVMAVAIAPGSSAEGTTVTTATDRLQMQLTVEFYTTDASAGPGSQPGPGTGSETVPATDVPTETTESGA